MPRANGAEAVRAARFRPGLDSSWGAAKAPGVRQVIAKPFTRDDLLAAARAALKPKAPSS